MIHAPRTFAPDEPADLSLPRWAFVAWGVYRRQADGGPRPALAPRHEADIEATRRARLLRELVPQD
jgi:hypothetical protein